MTGDDMPDGNEDLGPDDVETPVYVPIDDDQREEPVDG